MEGPYRDLGSGFARLLGVEGARRSPRHLRSVEDALHELLRNSRDAGARNIYVASSLHTRRYRQLVVIDDGRGIPETHKHLIFEPGVTTRHLDPVIPPNPGEDTPHGAGLSLYHIKNTALSTEVLSSSSPTAIKAIFDTQVLPEKTLQSGARPSNTNLPATLERFAADTSHTRIHLYHASPARILAQLLQNHIIRGRVGGPGSQQDYTARHVREAALSLGLEVSLRTVQRVVGGEVPAAGEVTAGARVAAGRSRSGSRMAMLDDAGGPILSVGVDDLEKIRGVLRRAAGSSYLELAGLDVETRPGEVILRARVYEPEEEYE